MGVDAAAHTVRLDSGQELGYEKLLIATGGRNRRLTVPGADLPGLHYLRTVAECEAIKREARPGRRAVIVGMGFIGCEVAASLTQLGVHVTTVFPGKVPLEKVLGAEVGAVIGAFHRANGVDLLAGEQIAAFEGTGRLERAVTDENYDTLKRFLADVKRCLAADGVVMLGFYKAREPLLRAEAHRAGLRVVSVREERRLAYRCKYFMLSAA